MSTLGAYQPDVENALTGLRTARVVARLWAHDHTVWKPDPTEITNRLGWLHLPETMRPQLADIAAFVAEVRAAGYTQALLLGMGGSSLAPELFSRALADSAGGLWLEVLDSTDPGAVLARTQACDPHRTLYIVSTKSGGTVETLSFFKYCYNLVAAEVGPEQAGQHFVVITDPGSTLEGLARDYRFRRTFLNDPTIGGRYSALSLFGLIPAALVGADIARLLDRAGEMAESCRNPDVAANPGAYLGAVMGALARAGRDKLTLVLSPAIASLGDWIEQLVAESTGKDGVGILPVVGEPLDAPETYGTDRLFVAVTLDGDAGSDVALSALQAAGHPVVRLTMSDRYDLGKQFMLWEFATAVAGHVLNINPFDQPNVEAAKVLARRAVDAFKTTGRLPEVPAMPPRPENLRGFLASARPGDYIALQAYLTPTGEIGTALQALQRQLRRETGLAVTIGYGPRFLHSTGQLHKGDGGRGLFIQLVGASEPDALIPDVAGQAGGSLSFGTLIRAQANGDFGALQEAGRRVVRFDLGADVIGGLQSLLA